MTASETLGGYSLGFAPKADVKSEPAVCGEFEAGWLKLSAIKPQENLTRCLLHGEVCRFRDEYPGGGEAHR